MTTLHLVDKTEPAPRVVWESFPSRAQFSWLYLLSAVSALRAAVFFRFGVAGWEMWLWGAGMLIVFAALLRRWALYRLTAEQIAVRNGYTGSEIQSLPLSDVGEVTLRQGIVAGFFEIGTLVIHSRTTDRLLTLRGISDPEEVKSRIEALAWRRNRTASRSSANS
jgi:membrane protein YdbS with pleckstrin-like domain